MRTQRQLNHRPSMGDVAKLAGVSTQTVSRVSNGEPYVSDEKRERVLEAMQQLGYRPNAAARAMKRGAFKTIGVIYESLHPVGTHRSLEAISEKAAAQGYATTIVPLDAAEGRATDGAFTRLGEMNVDALLAIIPSARDVEVPLIFPADVPAVILGLPIVEGASSVDFDQRVGTVSAMEHLLELGHQTIHHIGGPSSSYSAVSRRKAWEDTLAANGRQIPEVYEGDWSPQSGYLAAKQILAHQIPTAIFVANDQMALGTYRALLEQGLSIPGDVSIIGFDNIDESIEYPPPLSTVRQNWDLLGTESFKMTLDLLHGAESSRKIIPTEFIVRQSTASPTNRFQPK